VNFHQLASDDPHVGMACVEREWDLDVRMLLEPVLFVQETKHNTKGEAFSVSAHYTIYGSQAVWQLMGTWRDNKVGPSVVLILFVLIKL
jgi:hypothetical protein